MLELDNIYYSAGEKEILNGISAHFMPGHFSIIIGPNGSGKSTLLKIASGELNPKKGEVRYDNQKISPAKLHETAKIRAILAQQSELNFPLTVAEIVGMGRYPHYKSKPSKKDIEIISNALKELGLSTFKDRNYLTLSGGEKQRVHYGRVLAQLWHKETDRIRYLLLDEPVSFLDLNYQHEFLNRSKQLAKKGDVVVAVLHDISLAALYADSIFVLQNGKLIAEGSPVDIITTDLIFDLYGVSCIIVKTPGNKLSITVPDNQ